MSNQDQAIAFTLQHQTKNDLYLEAVVPEHTFQLKMASLSDSKFQVILPLEKELAARKIEFSFVERDQNGREIARESFKRVDLLESLDSKPKTIDLSWGSIDIELTSLISNSLGLAVTQYIRCDLGHVISTEEQPAVKKQPSKTSKSLTLKAEKVNFMELARMTALETFKAESNKPYLNFTFKSYRAIVKLCDLHGKSELLLSHSSSVQPKPNNVLEAWEQVFAELAQFLPSLGVHPSAKGYELIVQLSQEELGAYHNPKQPKATAFADPKTFVKNKKVLSNKSTQCSHFTNCICSLQKPENQGVICYQGIENGQLLLASLDNGAVIEILDSSPNQFFNICSSIFDSKEYISAIDSQSVKVFGQIDGKWSKLADFPHKISVSVPTTAKLFDFGPVEQTLLNVLVCSGSTDGIYRFDLKGTLLNKYEVPATAYIELPPKGESPAKPDYVLAATKSGLLKLNVKTGSVLQKANTADFLTKVSVLNYEGKNTVFGVSNASKLQIYDLEGLSLIKELGLSGTLYEFVPWTYNNVFHLIVTAYSTGIHVVNPLSGQVTTLSSGLGYNSHISIQEYRGQLVWLVGGCYQHIVVMHP